MEKHDTHLLSCSSSEEHSYKLDNVNESKSTSKNISKFNVQNQSARKYIDKNTKNTKNSIEKSFKNNSYNTEFTTLSNGVKIKKVKISAAIIPTINEAQNKSIIFKDEQKLLLIKKLNNRSFMTKICLKIRKNRRKISNYNSSSYFRFSSTQKMSNKFRNFPKTTKTQKGKLLLFQKSNSEKNFKKKYQKKESKEIIPKKIDYLHSVIQKRAMSSYSNLKSRRLKSVNSKIKQAIYDNTEFFTELKQLKNALQNESTIFNSNNGNNNYSYHLIYPRDPSPLLEEHLSCSSLLFPKTTNSNNKYEIKRNNIYEKHYGKENICPVCISVKTKYIIPNMKNNNLSFNEIKNKRPVSSYSKKSKFEVNSFNRLANTSKNYDTRWKNYLYFNGSNSLSDTIGGENRSSNYFVIEKYFMDDNVNENVKDTRAKMAKIK